MSDLTWDDFPGPHEAEIMTAHEGQPTVEWQNSHNGAPSPGVDDGTVSQEPNYGPTQGSY